MASQPVQNSRIQKLNDRELKRGDNVLQGDVDIPYAIKNKTGFFYPRLFFE
jgi:hypothetical protein